MTGWLCLAFALAFAGIGMLAILRAPTMLLFFLAVGATELGHIFAAAALAVVFLAPKHSSIGLMAAGISLVSAVLLLTPVLRAWWSCGKMRMAIEKGLGAGLRRPLLRFAPLWRPTIAHVSAGERLIIDGPGGPLGVDFYRSASTSPSPLVLVVHGGGWMAGDSGELSGWNAWLAEGGHAVAAVDYRLVPTGAWPAQCEDVLAVAEHLRANAGEFGIDAQRVVLFGRSAGGQIASAIAAAGGRPWLRGCVCFYALFDMDFAYAHGRDDDVLRSRWLLRCYLGGPPEVRAAAYRDASACLVARAGAPPFLLLHGTRDELVWVLQSRRLAARLTEVGVPNALVELPWATHAFDYNRTGPGGQVAAACLDAFLRRVCS